MPHFTAVIQLTFEEAVYEVSESIADSHLALLVCIVRNTSLEIQIPDNMVNITIATEEGTANGKKIVITQPFWLFNSTG